MVHLCIQGRKTKHNNFSSESHSPHFVQPLQPLRIKIFSENLGHKTWRMWLGRDIVVVGLPPLVHRSKQNMHNYAGPVDFLFSYYSVEIDCTSRFQAHCLSTKQLICYIFYYYNARVKEMRETYNQ